MWKPTIGKVKGKYFVNGNFFVSGYGVLVCQSHTGKMFEIELPNREVIGMDIGDVVFCNGDICRRMSSYDAALDRLRQVTKN